VAESTANLTQHVLSQIVDLIELPILLLNLRDDRLPLVLANPACQVLMERLCGRSGEMILSELLDEGTPSPDSGQIVRDLEAGTELTLRLRSGDRSSLILRLLPLRNKSGSVTHALGLVGDGEASANPEPVTRPMEDSAQAESSIDRVTGLLLQSAFERRFDASWAEAAQKQESVGVMIFRIDDFDAYVDTFGKQAANSARRLVGHAIGGSLRRAEDLAGRLDGDEFAGSICGAGPSGVGALAERIVSRVVALCIHHPRSEVTRYLSVSAGVFFSPTASGASVDALEHARRRAVRAREQGGNRVIDED
jgi:diguanylate cyclase (GGDEF)-like protein